MKLSLIFTSLTVLLTSVHAQLTVSFDTTYDNAAQSLNTVACSNGPNGLESRGFTTFGSLPKFPFIGGAPAVTGFDSPGCGTCWQLTFVDSQGVSTSINILAIDVATPNFNIALEAMNALTNGQATFLGRVPVTAVQVASSVCGL
ncbi:cerato-platanin-related secreted protein [Phlegmacium glaucopus]|nr:cerato-platanin-related secreted protein [Phlegmacium glaucopus]